MFLLKTFISLLIKKSIDKAVFCIFEDKPQQCSPGVVIVSVR